MEKLLTKSDVEKRGWSKEQVKYFTRKTHSHNENNEPAWQELYIENLEKSLSFKNFTTMEDFLKRTEAIEKGLASQNQIGIEIIKDLSLVVDQHDCLIKNKNNYDNLNPIFHLVKKDFVPDDNGSYSLFTDGCFKTLGRNAFACCAGWILDNKTNEIVVEFTKTLELSNKLANGMPEFELRGILEGVSVIKQLGLKNVQCFTDSSGEAKTILAALNNIGDSRVTHNIELYQPIIDILRDTNSKIGWVPREYNTHADQLTKIPLNAWLEHYNKIYLEHDHIKEQGYVVNREKEIYFHQDKVKCKDNKDANARWKLAILKPERDDVEKLISIVIYDTENKSVELLDRKELKDFDVDNSLPEEIKRIKKSKVDAAYLKHVCNVFEKIKDIREVDISMPPGVLAVIKKLTPIPPMLQEEYFDFHKFLSKFSGEMTVTAFEANLFREINDVFTKQFLSKEKKTSPNRN